jgi:hypothetical protein
MTSIAIVRYSRPALERLSIEETVEFELLGALPPIGDDGKPAWIFEGEPTTRREKRWLELYPCTPWREHVVHHQPRRKRQPFKMAWSREREIVLMSGVHHHRRPPSIDLQTWLTNARSLPTPFRE